MTTLRALLPGLLFGLRRGKLLVVGTALVLLGACSGVDVAPEPTDTFRATGYTRYAWRSDPPSQGEFSRDLLVQKSPSIRAGVDERMSQLGYTRVERTDAEFLIEYLAARGLADGQRARGSANETLYGSSVNRQVDGASADNAHELSGAVETGEIRLAFIDAASGEVLWRVAISMVVHDVNRVDPAAVERAVTRGLSSLPPAS